MVVRVCEPSYRTDELETQGISVRDLAYDDGTPPPQNIGNRKMLKDRFWTIQYVFLFQIYS